MQLPAQIVAKKQLLQTIGLTSAAFLIALPVGAAVLGSNGAVEAQGTTTVTKTVEDLGSCAAGTAQKQVTTTVRHNVVTVPTVTQTTGNGISQNGTGNQASQNGSGATAQASDHSIAAAVSLLNDVVDVNNVLNGNTVSVPVNVPILSGTSTNTGTGNGGLLGLGLLGL